MRFNSLLVYFALCALAFAALASAKGTGAIPSNSTTGTATSDEEQPFADRIPIHIIVLAAVVIPFGLVAMILSCTRCGRNIRASRLGHALASRPVLQCVTGRLPSKLSTYVRHNTVSRWLFEWILVALFEVTLAEVFVCLLYLVVASAFFVWRLLRHNLILYPDTQLIAVALGFGQLGTLNLMLVLLPVNRILISWFGLSFTRATRLHRFLAEGLLLFMNLHALLFIISEGIIMGEWEFLIAGFSVRQNLVPAGIASWICMVLMALLSSKPIRTRMFSLFIYSHYILGTLFVITACIHSYQSVMYYVLPSICFTLVDICVVRPLLSFGATLVHIEQCDQAKITKLVIKIPNRMLVPSAGSFVYLAVKEVSWISHPISIAGVDRKQGLITLYCKDTTAGKIQRNFTGKLRDLAKRVELGEIGTSSIKVQVQRPFGGSDSPDALHAYDIIIMIAGGIGISPLLSSLQYYSTPENSRRNSRLKSISLHWTVPYENTLSIFLEQIKTILAESSLDLHISIKVYISRVQTETSSLVQASPSLALEVAVGDARFKIEQSRLNVRDALRIDHLEEGTAGVFVCGPMSLVYETEAAVWSHNAKRWHGPRFQLHRELFDV